jgi:large subunit ribosomal protein L22
MGVYRARRILALIRGRSANQALDELRADRHRASRAIYKVLASAIANALQNPSVRANRLVVSKTFAQRWPAAARRLPHAAGPQGRAMPIKRRTCHIHVHVADPQRRLDNRETLAAAKAKGRVTMGQKSIRPASASPITEQWRSRWYANKKDFAKYLIEDHKIRQFIRKEWAFAAIPRSRSSAPASS